MGVSQIHESKYTYRLRMSRIASELFFLFPCRPEVPTLVEVETQSISLYVIMVLLFLLRRCEFDSLLFRLYFRAQLTETGIEASIPNQFVHFLFILTTRFVWINYITVFFFSNI